MPRAVELGGETVPAGARVLVSSTAANRDPQVVGDPGAHDPVGHASDNLVFGIGRTSARAGT